MNYPEKFQQFVEYSKVLSSVISYLDADVLEFHEILAEKADKLRPYLAKSYTFIAEYYSVPLSGFYKDILEESNTIRPSNNAVNIFQLEVNKWKSEEYIDSILPNKKEEKLFIDECLPELIAVLRVCLMNLQANMKLMTSVNQLVQNVSQGDDMSLFAAIHIDPLVESVPVVAERISFAESVNDKGFLVQLNKSRSAKRTDARQKNQNLNFILYFFSIAGVLDQLTESDMAAIFINELGVYNKDDASLFKHITRWKKEFKVHNQRMENKVVKMSKT